LHHFLNVQAEMTFMNARLQTSLPFASFGLMLAAFFLLTFHAGWILRGFDDQSIGLALAITAGVPLGCLFVVLAREQIKHVLQLVLLAAFEISGYLVLFTYPNAVMNVGYWPGAFYTATFSLLLGCMLSMLMLAASDLVKNLGHEIAQMQMLAGSIILPGAILGITILADVQDWYMFVLLAMIISPVAIILHFVKYEKLEAANSADQEVTLQEKDVNNKHNDPIKGLKLSLFLVPAFVNRVLLIGINGILMGIS
jgi:hypothetical protein